MDHQAFENNAQRIKTIKNLDPDEDLKLEFDKTPLLNGYQEEEEYNGNQQKKN